METHVDDDVILKQSFKNKITEYYTQSISCKSFASLSHENFISRNNSTRIKSLKDPPPIKQLLGDGQRRDQQQRTRLNNAL